MAPRLLCTLALGLALVHAASKPTITKVSKTPLSGSQKCPKGHFGSLSKDAAIPLCDAHYPDKKAKSSWAILFYRDRVNPLEGSVSVSDIANRLAIDLGNEPPEKSKNLKMKPKKQRTRIKDLAEKYEFEASIPKKGLEDKGKEALLKLGAVCCDCGGTEQKICENEELGYRVVRPGKEDLVMEGGESAATSADAVMRFIMDTLGFVKGGAAPADADEAPSGSKEAKKGKEGKEEAKKGKQGKEEAKPSAAALAAKLEKMGEDKKKAVEDEDYATAKKLKAEIEKLEEQLKTQEAAEKGTKESAAALEEKIKELSDKKTQATEEEDYAAAGKLKKEIAALQEKLKKVEL